MEAMGARATGGERRVGEIVTAPRAEARGSDPSAEPGPTTDPHLIERLVERLELSLLGCVLGLHAIELQLVELVLLDYLLACEHEACGRTRGEMRQRSTRGFGEVTTRSAARQTGSRGQDDGRSVAGSVHLG